MHAVLRVRAVLDLDAEGLPELLVLLAVFAEHGLEFVVDLLLESLFDDLELAVLLQHLTGDVEGQVLRVDETADEAEPLGQEFLAVLHDHDAGGIELQADFIVFRIEVHRGLGRDEQERGIGRGAFRRGTDGEQRVVGVIESVFVEVRVFLIGDFGLLLFPDGAHGVEHLDLFDLLVLVLRALFEFRFAARHADRVTDVVGVPFDETAELELIEVPGVAFVVGIFLHRHGDGRAVSVALRFLDGVAVRAGGGPEPGLLFPERFRQDFDFLRDHEGRVEADAELTDDVDVLSRLFVVRVRLEEAGTGLGDGAEIVCQFVFRHADAVVRDGQGPGFFVHRNLDGEVRPGQPGDVVGQGLIVELVHGVARV